MTRKATAVRAAVAAHRSSRAHRAKLRQLERELAGYATPRERLELEAILERHTPEQAAPARGVLARRAARAAGR